MHTPTHKVCVKSLVLCSVYRDEGSGCAWCAGETKSNTEWNRLPPRPCSRSIRQSIKRLAVVFVLTECLVIFFPRKCPPIFRNKADRASDRSTTQVWPYQATNFMWHDSELSNIPLWTLRLRCRQRHNMGMGNEFAMTCMYK